MKLFKQILLWVFIIKFTLLGLIFLVMLSENLPNLETKQMFGLIFVSGVLLTAAWCLNRYRKELQ